MTKRRKKVRRIWQRPPFAGAAVVSVTVLCVVAGAIFVFRSLAAVQPVGMPGNWNLMFDDEFNGSGLDTAKWNPGWFGTGTTGPVNSGEDACYSSSNLTEGGGVLNLNLVHQASSCNGHSEPYTGALVDTDGRYSFTYGYVEARIYLPGTTQVDNWPAWRTDGQNWPADGEMDVMEGLGGQACWHFHDPSGGPGGCANGNFSGWHTYGADWEPGVVTYYYDGVQVGRIASGITSSPMYLILQNTTSSSSPTVTPAGMQVDYVRVWSYGGPNTPTPTQVRTPIPIVAAHTPTPMPPHPGSGSATAAASPTPTPTPPGVGVGGDAGTMASDRGSGTPSPGSGKNGGVGTSSEKAVTVLGVKLGVPSVIAAALALGGVLALGWAAYRRVRKAGP